MLRLNLDDFLRDCRRSSDPTRGVWGSARATVWQLLVEPDNVDIEVPLVDVLRLPTDLPAFELPARCSPLDVEAGVDEGGEEWALKMAIPSSGATQQLKMFASNDEFRRQWKAATGGFLKHVDWEGNGAVVAGGLVEACLQSLEGTTVENNVLRGERSHGDVDIFFYGHKTWKELAAAASNVALQVLRGMEEAGSYHERLVRRKNTLTITAYNPEVRFRNQYRFGRPVQLVLYSEPTIAHILARFDLDCVQYAYGGGDAVWATPLSLRARFFMSNIFDVEQLFAGSGDLSTRYGTGLRTNARILKYAARGYAVAVPMGLENLATAEAAEAEVAMLVTMAAAAKRPPLKTEC